MLGRRRLRIKALQLLYAHTHDAYPLSRLQQPIFFDGFLSHTYRLYLYQFHFLIRLGDYVVEHYEESLRVPADFRIEGTERHLRLHANPVLRFIREHPQFVAHSRQFHVRWAGDELLLKRVFTDLRASREYQEYVQAADPDLTMHFEILRYILKHYPIYFPHLEAHMDEMFFNWEDDRDVAIQAAQRSLKRAAVWEDFLWYPYVEEGNKQFAHVLLVEAARKKDDLIEQWVFPHVEPRRFQLQTPLIDRLTLQLALAEMTKFDTPLQILINEYVYLARRYGHRNSAGFVNGVLDAVYRARAGEKKRFRAKNASPERP